jgi:hypothetical protein
MSAYIAALNAAVERDQAEREEKERLATQAVRERLTPLEERLSRLLATIPIEIQREGLSLSSLQASLRGRWRGNCHPGNLEWHYASLALKENGDGKTVLAFALGGIPPNEPISAFGA